MVTATFDEEKAKCGDDLKAIAKMEGINVEKEGWMCRYFEKIRLRYNKLTREFAK